MGSSTRVGHAIDGIFHLNIDQIEKIIYFPKKEYVYYTLKKEGELKQSFFGLFKKYYKKDTYYDFFDGEEINLDNLFKENPRLYLDPEDKKIYYKPYIVLRFISGKKENLYPESEQDALDFIDKLKSNLNLTENLW